ncbi:hypothetical protein VNO77_03954 [Canavalia gladiata]|uniref:Uncharacterized protein n=1 Tax=Canavalia gladiata TaxID=3824 RepID=A0AAN9R7B3_CANGL
MQGSKQHRCSQLTSSESDSWFYCMNLLTLTHHFSQEKCGIRILFDLIRSRIYRLLKIIDHLQDEMVNEIFRNLTRQRHPHNNLEEARKMRIES